MSPRQQPPLLLLTPRRATAGSCVPSHLLLVSPPVAPDSYVAPPSGSPLPASPLWHALSSSCLWPPQVSASSATLACPALPPVRRGAAPRRSSLLLVSPDDCSPVDPPHGRDLPVLRLHSDRGGEFSSNLLRGFCRGEGILQTFTLPESPQKNGIAERRIGLVMEVARTSMIHATAPHFLWPFAVQYAAHQLNLWPRVSLPETSPTLRWTGKVGDPSVFRVWGSRAFVRDTSADKLSPRAIPCVFLGFVPDATGWQFYHPTSHRVFPSQDITFDESVPFYRLFPYRSAPPPPPPLFHALGPPQVDPLPPQGAARGATSGGVEPGGAEFEGAETGGAEPGGVATGGAEPAGVATRGCELGGAEPAGVEPGGAESEGAESEGAEPQGAASSGGSGGASPRLSPQQPLEWFVQRLRLQSGASGAGGDGAARAGGPGVAAGAGVTGGTATTGPRGARTWGTGAVGIGGVEGAGAGVLTESGTTGAGRAGAGGAGVGGPGAGGAGAGGAGVGGPGVGGARAGGAGVVDPCGTVRPRPYFVPLLQQSQPPLQPASPLPAPSPYTEQSGGLIERREHASRPVLPVHIALRVPRSRPPPVLGTLAMTLRPPSVPQRVPLPAPPESSLPEVPDRARAANPTVSRLLATAVSDTSFESATASALVGELLDFVAACPLDYATALVAASASASPPSVGGECALGTDVLEDRQEDFECLAAAVPRFASMPLASEGNPDAPDIPTSRSYTEAITGPYSSQWQAAMDAEMASWKSIGTYVDEVPPPGANIVEGMWIFRVKRPPGSPPAFKARYVARCFSQRQGVDYFHTFSPTTKMTTLWVFLHVGAQHDYDLHSLEFSTAFLQGSLHEEIWLHRPPGFTESFPAGTQWSLRRPVYDLRQVPHEWHDTLRTTLAALGFAPATGDPTPTPRCRRSTSFSTARHTITLTHSHMVHQVLQRFGFQFSLPQPTPLSTSHSLSAPPSDESVEPSGPYPELVGCLITSGMGLVLGGRGPVVLTGHADASWVDDSATHSSCEAEIYAGPMGAQELRWLTYLLTDLGEQPRSPPHGLLRLVYVATRANTADVFIKALPPGDHQRFVTVLGLVPTLPHLLIA
ncbi:unnamed protein product [Closterium sp. NIES-53]